MTGVSGVTGGAEKHQQLGPGYQQEHWPDSHTPGLALEATDLPGGWWAKSLNSVASELLGKVIAQHHFQQILGGLPQPLGLHCFCVWQQLLFKVIAVSYLEVMTREACSRLFIVVTLHFRILRAEGFCTTKSFRTKLYLHLKTQNNFVLKLKMKPNIFS